MTDGERLVWAAAFAAYLQECRGTSLTGGFLPRAGEQASQAAKAANEAVVMLRRLGPNEDLPPRETFR